MATVEQTMWIYKYVYFTNVCLSNIFVQLLKQKYEKEHVLFNEAIMARNRGLTFPLSQNK